jgi:hypothetical protein
MEAPAISADRASAAFKVGCKRAGGEKAIFRMLRLHFALAHQPSEQTRRMRARPRWPRDTRSGEQP